MTAENLKNLLTALPVRVLKKIKKISKETGESVETVVERAVDRYGARAKPLVNGNDELAELLRDPKKRALFAQITTAMSRRANASLTPSQKMERALKAANARSQSLTPARRKEIAKASAQARWQRRDEQRKAEESGSKKPPAPKE